MKELRITELTREYDEWLERLGDAVMEKQDPLLTLAWKSFLEKGLELHEELLEIYKQLLVQMKESIYFTNRITYFMMVFFSLVGLFTCVYGAGRFLQWLLS